MASLDHEEADDHHVADAGVAPNDDLIYDPLIDGELEQKELNSDFLLNTDIPTSSKQLKKEEPEAERKEDKDGMQNNLKSTLLFSGIVIAVIGAIFAVMKKIKEA